MIPLKLQIKNFLSYGPDIQTVDFSSYHLICLSGKNGHGKSALLDAITWAIWGQARKVSSTTKADANLLHLGQTQMMVCFDFVCNNQTYRVKREYTKTYGKPLTNLDFGILDVKNDTISPLTEKTIRSTQQKIEQTIHLTFDTFSNSAFLRQGHANEFSKKSPKERKEIFAQILGLQQYEALRKLAMEKAKDTDAKKTGLLIFQEKLQTELQKSEEIDAALSKLEIKLNEIEKEESSLQIEQKKLKEEKKKLAEQHKQQELLLFQQKELRKKEIEQEKILASIKVEWKKFNELQKNLPDHATLEKEKNTLLNTITQHQKNLQDILALKEKLLKKQTSLHTLEKKLFEDNSKNLIDKKNTLERLLIKQENALNKEQELKKHISEKNKKKHELEQTLKKLQAEFTANNVEKKELQTNQEKLIAGKEQYQQLIAQGNVAKKELNDLSQKQQLSDNDANPSCPLCEQNLSASRKKFLKSKFAKQKKLLNLQIKQITNEITRLKSSLIAQHAQLEKQKKKYEHALKLTIQIDELKKANSSTVATLSQLESEIKNICSDTAEIEKKIKAAQKNFEKQREQGRKNIKNNPEYSKLSASCTTIQAELQKIDYQKAQHQTATKKLQEIEKMLAESTQLQTERALQGERKKQMNALSQSLEIIVKQKAKIVTNLEQYSQLAKQEKQNHDKEEQLILVEKKLKDEKENLLQEKGGLKNQKNKLKVLQKEHAKQQEIVHKLHESACDYYDIAQITSKNGIQALLIENAIPEVEQEANRLLAKLTNNQAQIFIESLRDLKKGGTKETLDIKISDAAGIRPYELFSGGEAFRIDFALRIAISKLLARRAGTSLQTLIIDEGFGSQDEEGLALIMETIHKIQEDFLKVIVVSHLTSMKDQFPIHFTVEKSSNGSKVNVLHFGL